MWLAIENAKTTRPTRLLFGLLRAKFILIV